MLVLTCAVAFSQGNTILNGTRNGSTWLWDLRARRRIQEHVATHASSASILDVHILSDNFQVVMQRSDGELTLVDTRTHKTVVEFVSGRRNTYLPMLKCAIDGTETVVVAAASGGHDDEDEDGNSTICSYQISTGKRLAEVKINKAKTSKAVTMPLEQVHLRQSDPTSGENRSTSDTTRMSEMWALSRNELFVCTDGVYSGSNGADRVVG